MQSTCFVFFDIILLNDGRINVSDLSSNRKSRSSLKNCANPSSPAALLPEFASVKLAKFQDCKHQYVHKGADYIKYYGRYRIHWHW
jgi:hypothetical protein